MRDQLLKALLAHAQGDIQKHVANVEVYLSNPVGIGEHSNIVEAIEEELNMIAKYEDQVEVIKKYFKKWLQLIYYWKYTVLSERRQSIHQCANITMLICMDK